MGNTLRGPGSDGSCSIYVQYVQKSYVPHWTAQPGHCVILTQHMRSDLWEKGRTDPYLCKTKTTRNDLWVMSGLKQVLDRREEERATGSPKREVRSPSITESHSKGALVYHLLSVPHSSLRLRPRWLSILSLNDCFSLPPPPEWVPHNQAHQTTTQKPVSVTLSSEWKEPQTKQIQAKLCFLGSWDQETHMKLEDNFCELILFIHGGNWGWNSGLQSW